MIEPNKMKPPLNKMHHTTRYLLLDLISSIIGWLFLSFYRKNLMYQGIYDFSTLSNMIFNDINFYKGVIIIPFIFIGIFALSDSYREVYRKSRLKVLFNTVLQCLIGVTIIFFIVVLDDYPYYHYKYLYNVYFLYFGVSIALTYILRLSLMTWTKNGIKKKKIVFNTLIIGNNNLAEKIYQSILKNSYDTGQHVVGYIKINGGKDTLHEIVPCLSKLDDIGDIILKYYIEDIYIVLEPADYDKISNVLSIREIFNVNIYIVSDVKNILVTSSVKIHPFSNIAYIEVPKYLLSTWQSILKRTIDIFISTLALILLSPLLVFIAIKVKKSSPGPIIYKQERIGRYGIPFNIYKFRSMYIDAEANGPALSCKDDDRVTPWGKVMRKYRFDELPQFFNVIKGDMSLVGPRPERQYYIDQIVKIVPYYRLLLKLKPGITSWGQVKYGYAENVDQMVERLYYDLLYLDNISLFSDFKILILTIIIIFKGEGK
jgi:exopolysaccharide biosynthesis polyprenyl glycosylphosphotransferase